MRNVYKIHEVNKHRFYQVPKELFENEFYSDLSSDAKLLYGMLLDRMKLSEKNDWVNDDNEIFLIFSRQSAQDLLNISKPTATKVFKELKHKKLIFEERQGFNRPNIIFIGKICYKKSKEKPEKSRRLKNLTSRGKNSLPPEVKKFNPNDTDLNDTEINDTENEKGFGQNPNFETPVIFDFATGYAANDYEIDNVSYYFRKYRQFKGKEHEPLKPSQWKKVFNKITTAGDKEVLGNIFKRIVDQHFQTKYKKCDYNINHFISGRIMLNRYYEIERDEDQDQVPAGKG